MRRYFGGWLAVLATAEETRTPRPADHGPSDLREDHMPHTPSIVRRDRPAWRLRVWISFRLSACLCVIGLAWLCGGWKLKAA